jgi:hypothetical protein
VTVDIIALEVRMRGVGIAALVATALSLLPGEAQAGYELVPFGGVTRMSQGDVFCDEEIQTAGGGVAIGYSALGLGLGGRILHVSGSGRGGVQCAERVSMDILSLYFNAPLFKTDLDIVGVGAELPVAITGKATNASGATTDLSGGSGFSAEAFYLRFLSKEGSVKKGQETFPAIIFAAQVRAGYRIAEVTTMDSAFNDRGHSLDGAFVTVGMMIYFNPQ